MYDSYSEQCNVYSSHQFYTIFMSAHLPFGSMIMSHAALEPIRVTLSN